MMKVTQGHRGSGSGYSADFSTVLLLLDGTQIMTGNLHMNSKKVFSFGNPSGVTDASNSKYVDTISNNKLSGSETFQGDVICGYHLYFQRLLLPYFCSLVLLSCHTFWLD